LCSTPSKKEEETSLDETDSWIRKGGKTTFETDGETGVETFNETDGSEMKEKQPWACYIHGESDCNISSPYSLYFSESKTSLLLLLSSSTKIGLAKVL
jgi:hypothetical protein